MYHTSCKENRSGISASGLLSSSDQTGHGAVFLAEAMPKASDSFDVWVVDVSGLDLTEDFTGDPDDDRWWMYYGDIDKSLLKLDGSESYSFAHIFPLWMGNFVLFVKSLTGKTICIY